MEEMSKAEQRPFDLEMASHEVYDPTRYQPVLFVADSFEQMQRNLSDFLLRWCPV
jgi:phenylalanine-4-hydroxylase